MNTYPSGRLTYVRNPSPYTLKILETLPQEFVLSIDRVILQEVVPFVRRFGALSTHIQKEAVCLAETNDPGEYYDKLTLAWDAHNALAIEIDDFLSQHELGWPMSLDKSSMSEALDLIRRAIDTEDRKRVASAGIKHHLNKWIEHGRQRASLNDHEMNAVLTTYTPNYWLVYDIRLIEYILAVRSGVGSQMSECFMTDFHAGNSTLMQSRVSASRRMTEETGALSNILKHYDGAILNIHEMALRGAYIALENQLLKSIRLIIEYDNFHEYCFGHNLYGIPDLVLRKAVITSLINAHAVTEKESVLLYTYEDISKGVTRL